MSSTKIGNYVFRMEKDELVLEFQDFNGLYKGSEAVEGYIKKLLKEVSKFKRWKKYQESLKQPALFNAESVENFVTNM